jgi:hypothetical protein
MRDSSIILIQREMEDKSLRNGPTKKLVRDLDNKKNTRTYQPRDKPSGTGQHFQTPNK